MENLLNALSRFEKTCEEYIGVLLAAALGLAVIATVVHTALQSTSEDDGLGLISSRIVAVALFLIGLCVWGMIIGLTPSMVKALSSSSNGSVADDGGSEDLPPEIVLPKEISDRVQRIFTEMEAKDASALKLREDYFERNRLLAQSKALYHAACERTLHFIKNAFPPFDGDGPFRARVYDVMPNLGAIVEDILQPFWENDTAGPEFQSGHELRHRYLDNQRSISEGLLQKPEFARGDVVFAPHYLRHTNTNPAGLVQAYLFRTPFQWFFQREVPFKIPDERRFEHQWVLAPPGQGKSTLLDAQIAHDLRRVEAGTASLVVMDSQKNLLKKIRELRLFAPGQPLHGKLTLIEPDPTNVTPLNFFAIGRERMTQYSEREQEQLANATIEMVSYVFTDLSEAEATSKQAGLLRHCCRLIMEIEGATIMNLRDLLQTGLDGPAKYRQYLPKLDRVRPDGSLDTYERTFFETSFGTPKDSEYRSTKQEVIRRLDTVRDSPHLRRMFTDPRPAFDLFAELDEGRVILIDTDQTLLEERGTEIFGRIFLALLRRIGRERDASGQNMPTFVYVDEAYEYIAYDIKIEGILSQIRKQQIGLILAHHRMSQIKQVAVKDALADVATVLAAGNRSDLAGLSKIIELDPEIITRLPKGSFAATIRHVGDRPIILKVPEVSLAGMPKMSPEEIEAMRVAQLERFASTVVRQNEPEMVFVETFSNDHTKPSFI